MKNIKIAITIFIVLIIGIILGIFLYFKSTNNLSKAKVQILRFDALDKKEEIIKKYSIKKDDVVVLDNFSDYYGCGREPNNIKILSITKNSVKISRNKKMYRLIGAYKDKSFQELGATMYSLVEGKDFESYTEEVIADIKYGEKISFSIDQVKPSSPECSQSRYTLFVVFSK